MHRVGLRFPRSQARVLTAVVERIHARELGKEHATIFEQAAEAARTGEPLIVECTDPVEAIAIADGFTQFGVARPALDNLTTH